MSVEIKVPTLGESVTEATVAKWFKAQGEAIAADEPLVELETDKVTVEINAPVSGTIAEITVGEGDEVEVGALLGFMDEGDAPAAASPEPAGAPAEASAAGRGGNGAAAPRAAAGSEPGGPRPTPSEATPSEATPSEATPSAPTSSEAAPSAPAPGEAAGHEPAAATAPRGAGPAARKAAREGEVDLAGVEGTGPKGNVTKADVASARGGGGAGPATAKEAPAPTPTPTPGGEPAAPPPPPPGRGGEERVKMTRLRKRIAERLKQAQNTAAMLTTFNEVDMSAITELRRRHQDAFVAKHGFKLGFMSFFVKAAIEALKSYPTVNAEIDGDEIVYKHYYDIGVAVSTESGLVVPVVRGADQMSFAGIERIITELGHKARDGKLAMDDLMGGTFSISNGGVFGSMMSTPILNPPQVGILGMHKTMRRPMVMEDGRLEARPMMYLALSYDHRIIDGREAVSFLVRVKECIEDPERMLLDA